MKNYDVLVIGSGAGNIIIEEAVKKGLRCAQIEKGKAGGTCLTRGCIPTKVMTTAADRVLEIKKAQELGIDAEIKGIDWSVISDRVWDQVNISKALEKDFVEMENLDYYKGVASFVDNHTVKINDADNKEETITADKIFIAVGGRTNVPGIEGLDEAGYVITETFFGEKFPKELYKEIIIIGGGAIGTEFAHVFSALGTKVHIVQRNVRLLPKEEPELSAIVLERYKERGIHVHLGTDTVSAGKKGDKKFLRIKNKETGEEQDLVADEILVSPGIVSNADLLHLENTDVQLDEKNWIRTNEFLETTAPGIWAIGDVNGKQQFRHKANYEADIVSYNNFMNKEPDGYRWARYDLVPAVTYITPQVAHVGLSEEAALKAGYEIKVGKHYYSQTAKGFSLGYTSDDPEFAKVIVDKKTKKILGFHAVGTEASTLIQPFLNQMNAGKTKLTPVNEDIASPTTAKLRAKGIVREMEPGLLTTMRETMVPHPSLNEVGIWTYYFMKNFEQSEESLAQASEGGKVVLE